jgi:hypothetical protein
VFTQQTLPACDEPFDDGLEKAAWSFLHAGVAARQDQTREARAPAVTSLPVESQRVAGETTQSPWSLFLTGQVHICIPS